ncbi:MAG: hypothetical protein IJX71_01830 [Oscillospiraceae bacterium]|nr:hypothetical protein [Oscillospiraceae bacterium]
MSKPRDRWWGYVRAVIRAYPELRERYGELHRPGITPRYSAGGSSGSVSDPTAQIALRQLPRQEQREFEAVEAAVRETVRLSDGETRLTIIELVFWRQSHTLEGAAQKTHMSYRSAQRRQNAFIRLVAEKMGLTEKLGQESQKDVVNW